MKKNDESKVPEVKAPEVAEPKKEINLDKIAISIVEEIKSLRRKAGEVIKEIKEKDVVGLLDMAPEVIQIVQKLAKNFSLNGEMKKKVVVKVLNIFINVRIIPESVEALIISKAIDMIVKAYKSNIKD